MFIIISTIIFNWVKENKVTDQLRYFVNLAFQFKMGSDLVVGIQNVTDFIPQFALALQVIHIANHEESLFGARQGDADAVLDAQESNVFFFVASDERQDDNVILFALEIVNHGDTNRLNETLLHSSQFAQVK